MILYLDIDGVLNDNTQKGILNRYGYPTETAYAEFCKLRPKDEDKFLTHLHQLDIGLCLMFVELLEALQKEWPETEIVICSTWRKVFSVEELKYLFYLKGFPLIAQNIKRYIIAYEDLTISEKIKSYLIKSPENLKQADFEVLYDLHKNNIEHGDYCILSDDISCLKSNLYGYFRERIPR